MLVVGLPWRWPPSSLQPLISNAWVSRETAEAKEPARARERTEGEANAGTAAQHFHILINPTWIHAYTEGEEIAFLKLCLYQRVFRRTSPTRRHTQTCSPAFSKPGGKKWTNTSTHANTQTGKAQRDYSLLTTAAEHTHRHKNRKLPRRSSVWGSSN